MRLPSVVFVVFFIVVLVFIVGCSDENDQAVERWRQQHQKCEGKSCV